MLQNKSIHSTKCLEDEKVLFFTYNPLRYRKQWRKFLPLLKKDSIPPRKSFLCHFLWAGFFGGQKRMIKELYKLFYKELEVWYKRGIYFGDEENIFSYISIHYPDIIKVVKTKKSYIEETINELK